VYHDDEEGEDMLGLDQAVSTDAGDGVCKKKGDTHRTAGFTDREDELLCVSWFHVSQDVINGAQQKVMVYWCKVSQDYNERKLHKPFNIINNRNVESIKKYGPI
jgi:hypothetical protein